MSKQDDVATSVERADPLVGTIFDKRFKVEERIAAGGFGAIYRATHVKSGHRIALKVLLPSLAQDLGVVARFRREGDALTTLRNPHTINAYELGQAADRTLFIVMELLYGESLFERYKANGPFEWKRMAKIAREVCESLEEAHALGIVHRDLKPTNIHLEQHGDDRDYVKVLDFGIAKILGSGAADLTNAGQMIGTIDYMSPEQMLGGAITGQTDIYTLGIVMYEMIAGCLPFGESMTASQALAAVMKTKPQPLYLRAPVPDELDRIVMRCLERDTSRRYARVGEMRADLERLLAGASASRTAQIDTKPIVKHDDEATQFTPPPEPLLAEARRSKRPTADEATQFTPPPEQLLADARRPNWPTEPTTAGVPSAQLLAEARRSKRPTADEATQLTTPPESLLAQARRPGRPSDFEATQLTPPPVQLLADSRDDWMDDDERMPTHSRRARSSEDHERVTAVARLADIVERAAMTRGDATDRAVTVPVPRASEPDLPTAQFPREPASAPRPMPAPSRTLTPQTPLPQLVAAPFSAAVPQPVAPPPAIQPYVPPGLPPPPAATFEVGRMTARDAMIRRLIWIAAIVVAIGIGAILAIQL